MNLETRLRLRFFLNSIIFNGCLVFLALWLGRGQIAFVLFSVVFMFLGRNLGWWLSKASLYRDPLPLILVECVVWGGLIACIIHSLITCHHPHWILKWVFGFGVGSYVSMPNYGLHVESSVPDHMKFRHLSITTLPFLAFILCSVLLAYAL